MQLSGVYKLVCENCDKVYIGQTGRSFYNRIKEHFRSYLNNDSLSNYSSHLNAENHHFNREFKVLHRSSKGVRLNALEFLEINKRKNLQILLNDQLDVNSSPLLNLKFR